MNREKIIKEEILSFFPNPFYSSTHIYFYEDLEEIGLLNVLDDIPHDLANIILDHARTLSKIKPELSFHFLFQFKKILELIEPDDLSSWVSIVLDIFDSKGLNPAIEFIKKLDEHPEFVRHWGRGSFFQDHYPVLLNFLHALGGENLKIESGPDHYTDTTTIYLPERIAIFPDNRDNYTLFKIMLTHKYAQIKLGTYRLNSGALDCMADLVKEGNKGSENLEHHSDLSRFLNLFQDSNLARDLYLFGDTVRIESWIKLNLPGLYRQMVQLKKQLAFKENHHRVSSPKNKVVDGLVYHWLSTEEQISSKPILGKTWQEVIRLVSFLENPDVMTHDLARFVIQSYRLLDQLEGTYDSTAFPIYFGELRPEEAEREREYSRRSRKVKFRQDLAELIKDLPEPETLKIELPSKVQKPKIGDSYRLQEFPNHLLVDGNPLPIPEGLQKTIKEILEDLGSIPLSYLTVADDMTGHFWRSACQISGGTSYVLSENSEGIHILDEWDYRRQGYRKKWALLRETEASEGGLTFARDTLKLYGGIIQRIKRQFERIRLDQLLLRRQREGDNLDLDAVIEAYTDTRAGLTPSDQVFTYLQRDKRDIATVFLIDLSGSTSGWINQMERTSLLILCEALQILKDRFAIYGFSGRTRKRCELFRIKGFDDQYDDSIKRRIANLRALEYTRLGPPIRHLTRLMSKIEAKTRLMITLSDGKPDDYDGYRGDYGIEDTRQALIEAQNQGIHPFCITIDKAEHSYLSHMYGPVNYTFIDDINKLPLKIPEIYRKLTT